MCIAYRPVLTQKGTHLQMDSCLPRDTLAERASVPNYSTWVLLTVLQEGDLRLRFRLLGGMLAERTCCRTVSGSMIYTLLSCPLAGAGGWLADGVQAAGGYSGGAHLCDAAGGTGALHRVAVHPGAAVGPPAGAVRKVSSCVSSFLPVLLCAPSASCSMLALHAAAAW